MDYTEFVLYKCFFIIIIVKPVCTLTKASYSRTTDSMIILLFPSPISISNQSIVNQNYIENDVLSTVRRCMLART